MSSYSELRTSVESWAVRTDFPTSLYELATADINRDLRVREMLADHTATVSTESTALPADFIAPFHAYLDRDCRVPLRFTAEFTKDAGYRSSGTPAEVAVSGDNLLLNPVPDGSYDLVLRYYAKLAPFSADADTNDVLDEYPDIYLAACLRRVFMWAEDDEREMKWEARFRAAVTEANARDRQARYGGRMAMRARATA